MATEEFNLEKLHDLFGRCVGNGTEDIIMDAYVDAYEELSKLFNLLGSVFHFVTSDVVEKIGILRDYRKSDESEHYKTVQSMIKYEVDKNITDCKKKASGSRTLLRLHRALEFTARLMLDLEVAQEDMKMSSLTKKAYDDTLSKFHPWMIRKGVHLAVYTLPGREAFLEKLKIKDPSKTKELLGRVAADQTVIYEITQRLYAEDNLLDLP
ncbi:hypothetical protein FSP39_002043 [Pinctada imbricata]|uniref:Glycolipid transfer protein domain-containing protein n=1 Tax=Pinctada imbricata TaxID=66713 RepID=A0AA89C3H3_PINIB|nr:hypothetical protein FSP39_002043 [Pinctada imbricata]